MAAYTLRAIPGEWAFWRAHRGQPIPPMPPLFLRYRVSKFDINMFHASGLVYRRNFEQALRSIGREMTEFDSILDFGVGCSRVLRWMPDLAAHSKLYGTDIDAAAIRWSRRHIPFAELGVNQHLPPLAYPDQTFDLIYSMSVFTHLNETYQDRWLAELARVSRPGAVLLVTTHGLPAWEATLQQFPNIPGLAELARTFRRDGFLFYTHDGWSGLFPEYYHTAFHHPDYIRRRWSRQLDVLSIIEAGLDDFQDIIVLREPASG